ncbi:MAG: hypothetical protein OK454_06110 [Thaumarchaeota archaeon]|nr:hypothetical protein [Nitrososphaerota archaeon]
MFAYSKSRLMEMSREELHLQCQKLTLEWAEKGYPGDERMPVWMLAMKAALQTELSRRGDQLSLL